MTTLIQGVTCCVADLEAILCSSKDRVIVHGQAPRGSLKGSRLDNVHILRHLGGGSVHHSEGLGLLTFEGSKDTASKQKLLFVSTYVEVSKH